MRFFTVNKNLKDLHQSVEANRIKFESKVVEIEDKVNKIQETVDNHNKVSTDTIKEVLDAEMIPKIKDELKKDILSPVEVTWNAIQAQKVHEHEHNLIVFR